MVSRGSEGASSSAPMTRGLVCNQGKLLLGGTRLHDDSRTNR